MGVPGFAPILPPAAQPGLMLFHSLSEISVPLMVTMATVGWEEQGGPEVGMGSLSFQGS